MEKSLFALKNIKRTKKNMLESEIISIFAPIFWFYLAINKKNHVDLMMYYTRLHCYVAIELKVVDFKPEFLSKLNYYISAIDDLVKMPEDNPTIGLLLCRTKNNTKVEYALRGMTQPLGVAEFQTNKMIEELKIRNAFN